MGWVHIKSMSAYGKVGRVRRFQKNHASWLQHPYSRIQQLQKRRKRKVLDDVERSDRALTFRWKRVKKPDGIRLVNRQATASAFLYERGMRVHAHSNQVVFGQNLQPLAAATSEVEHRPVFCARIPRADPVHMFNGASLDFGPRSTEGVLEIEIKRTEVEPLGLRQLGARCRSDCMSFAALTHEERDAALLGR